MSLWLLEAKAFPQDTRSKEATSTCFILTPGTYSVGRKEGQCDIDVPEDKSISRIHAEIKVPSINEIEQHSQPPSIIATDKSKYGTVVSKDNTLEGDGQVGTVQHVEHRWLVKFGYSSPFRVKKLDWNVVIHPSCSPETSAVAIELGFAIINDIHDLSKRSEPNETSVYLIMPSSEAVLDGLLLQATMAGIPVVSAGWVSKWKERKVWKNDHPKHEDYPVHIQIKKSNTPGGAAPGLLENVAEKAREAAQRHPLKKLKFLWKPSSLDHQEQTDRSALALQQAITLAGGKLLTWPESKAKLPKKDLKSIIVVVKSAQELQEIPPYLQNFKWTTYDSLILAILDENPLKHFQNPKKKEEDDEELVETSVEGVGAGGDAHHHALAKIPDSEDEEMEQMELEKGEEEEEETQAEESHEKNIKKGKSTPSRATRSKRKIDTIEESLPLEEEEQEDLEESKGKRFRNKAKSAASGAAADPSPAAGASPLSPSKRQKTRGTRTESAAPFASKEDSVSILVDSPPSVHPSPSKLGRKKEITNVTAPADTPAPAAVAQAPSLALAADTTKDKTKSKSKVSASPSKFPIKKTLKKTTTASMTVPEGEGWKSRAVRKTAATTEKQQGAATAAAAGETGQPAPFTTAAAIAPAAADGQPSAPLETKTAVAVAPAAPTDAAKVQQEVKPAVDASTVYFDKALIVAPSLYTTSDLPPDGHTTGGFKAFRRKGSTVQGGTARLPRIPFDPEPYRAGDTGYKNDDFLREEAEKEAATKVADALFDANLKPKRDKKALDEGRRKLIAMLPEAARRRLG